jgi:hypothetical protein
MNGFGIIYRKYGRRRKNTNLFGVCMIEILVSV